MKKLLLLTVWFVVALSVEAVAQQQSPTLVPSSTPAATTTRSDLVLEVSYNPAVPSAYIRVGPPDAKPHWVWVTRLVRLPDWQLPAGALPVKAVRFEAQFNGETTSVKVSVLRGEKAFEAEDPVDSYQLELNDPRFVTNLKNFGIAPAKITVITAPEVLPMSPAIINKTNSISVVNVFLESEPLPRYRIVFQNLSSKDLLALRVDVTSPNRGPITTMLQGEDGRPVIDAGGLIERYMPAATLPAPNREGVPGLATTNSIVLGSAVFGDGSFEGDLEPACLFESFQIGRKLWLERVLTLFDEEVAVSGDVDDAKAAESFKEKLSMLKFSLPAEDARIYSRLPANCPKARDGVQTAILGQRLELLRELDSLIKTHPVPHVTFRQWLEKTSSRYRAWLSRL